jgi:hypothetical protein
MGKGNEPKVRICPYQLIVLKLHINVWIMSALTTP